MLPFISEVISKLVDLYITQAALVMTFVSTFFQILPFTNTTCEVLLKLLPEISLRVVL